MILLFTYISILYSLNWVKKKWNKWNIVCKLLILKTKSCSNKVEQVEQTTLKVEQMEEGTARFLPPPPPASSLSGAFLRLTRLLQNPGFS